MDIKDALERLNILLDIPDCEDKDYKKQPIPYELEAEIFDEQDGKCYLHGGGTTQPYTHRIIPNGPATKENLVMLCNTCHFWVHLMLSYYKGYRKAIRAYGYSPYG